MPAYGACIAHMRGMGPHWGDDPHAGGIASNEGREPDPGASRLSRRITADGARISDRLYAPTLAVHTTPQDRERRCPPRESVQRKMTTLNTATLAIRRADTYGPGPAHAVLVGLLRGGKTCDSSAAFVPTAGVRDERSEVEPGKAPSVAA